MDIAGMAEWKAARETFERMWQSKHPSTAPPNLYPAHPEDPLWVQADQMMDTALVQAKEALNGNAALQSAVQSPTWVALAGYIGCPNNHTFGMSAQFCPHCGLGPVPPWVRLAAEEAARRMGERAGLAMIQLGGL